MTVGSCPRARTSRPFHKLKAASLARDATETAGRREESGEENDQPLAVHLKNTVGNPLQECIWMVDSCNMLHTGGGLEADMSGSE